MCLSPDGKKIEVFATGIRFSPGMAFNDAGDLFLSDNRGNQNRYEEINHIEKGKFYGNNPRKYEGQNEVDPLVKVKHGVASGGIRFNRANNFLVELPETSLWPVGAPMVVGTGANSFV